MKTKRKALLVGINNYAKGKLDSCLNDVKELEPLLAKNEDGSDNFEVEKLLDVEDSATLLQRIEALFAPDEEHPLDVALFYFSGHGTHVHGGQIILPYNLDNMKNSFYVGIKLNTILRLAERSNARNKVIILDSCYSGIMGEDRLRFDNRQMGDVAVLGQGITILTACGKKEESEAGYLFETSRFTTALVDALKGEAKDEYGRIFLPAIFHYAELQFSERKDKTPLFKANVDKFMVIRQMKSDKKLPKPKRESEAMSNPQYSLYAPRI